MFLHKWMQQLHWWEKQNYHKLGAKVQKILQIYNITKEKFVTFLSKYIFLKKFLSAEFPVYRLPFYIFNYLRKKVSPYLRWHLFIIFEIVDRITSPRPYATSPCGRRIFLPWTRISSAGSRRNGKSLAKASKHTSRRRSKPFRYT